MESFFENSSEKAGGKTIVAKTTLILIRHGYSEANDLAIFAGIYNTNLTERGQEQAEKTAEYLKDRKIDAIYSSDLDRAVQTATPIAQMQGLEINQRQGLREIFGGEWEGKPVADLFHLYPEDYNYYRDHFAHGRCTRGESTREVCDRVLAEVKRIASEHEGQTVCIVSHATALRVITPALLGKPFETVTDITYVPNCSVTEAVYDGESFTLVCSGYAEHLAGLSTELPNTF